MKEKISDFFFDIGAFLDKTKNDICNRLIRLCLKHTFIYCETYEAFVDNLGKDGFYIIMQRLKNKENTFTL